MVQLACQAEGEGIVQQLGPGHGATYLANEHKRIARVQNWPDIIFGLCVFTFLCLLIFIGIFLSFCPKMEHQTMLSVTHTCQLRSALCLLSEVGRSALTTPEFWLVSSEAIWQGQKQVWSPLEGIGPDSSPLPQGLLLSISGFGAAQYGRCCRKKELSIEA